MILSFRTAFVFLTLVLSTGDLFAQKIVNKQLSNGLEVIVIPNSNVPLVTIEISVKNGAFTEPPELNGLSHLYEHMFFKGNEKFPDQEAYMKKVRQLGMEFNGTTSVERVNYFYTMPSSNLRPGLEFMMAAISTPKFDKKEFEKEKKVVLGEVDRNESNPYYWSGQAVNAFLWHAYPSRKDSLGDRKTIIGATIAQMKKMKETYYVPNNSALIIAGDVDPSDAFSMANEIFSDWKRGADPFLANPVLKHPPLAKNQFALVQKEVKTPYFRVSWHGPSVETDPKATFAADVLSYILQQPNGKFRKALVESGVSLGTSLSYYTQKTTGPIDLNSQIKAENIKTAIPIILKELNNLTLPNYYTDQQLESAKEILAIGDLFQREKTSTYAQTVSFWWATAGLDYYRNYIKNLRSVTRADINNYITKYINGKNFVASILISKSEATKLGLTVSDLQKLVESAEN